MSTIEIELPKMHEGQAELESQMQRFNVVACGRRWGKTEFQIIRAIKRALDGQYYGWFAPNYKFLDEPFRKIIKYCKPAIKRSNGTDRVIEFITGGQIEFWTLEDENAGRGRKYHEVGIDEAGLVNDLGTIWREAIRPTLSDYRGQGCFYGTPKGKNWFFEAWQLGENPEKKDWASFRRPTLSNPYIPASEIDDARDDPMMDVATFEQEYEAKFVENDMSYLFLGTYFHNKFIEPNECPELSQWYRGWDTATSNKETADETASIKVGFDMNGNCYLRSPMSMRLAPAELTSRAEDIAMQDGMNTLQIVEAHNTGYAIFNQLQRNPLMKTMVKLQQVGGKQGDKRQRALPLATLAEKGRLYIVKDHGWQELVSCLTAFTGVKGRNERDHLVDAASVAVLWARESPSTTKELPWKNPYN
jgi:predicted phage terminase large subunit-like protein